MAEPSNPYPATLSIDFPDREMDRLSTFFRILIIIPILIILSLLLTDNQTIFCINTP